MALVTKELEKKADSAMHELHQLNIYMKSIAQSLQKIADRPEVIASGPNYVPIPGEGVLYANTDYTGQPGA